MQKKAAIACFVRRRARACLTAGLLGLLTALLPLAPNARADRAEAPSPPILSAAEVDYPPFCLVDEHGRPDGFSVELLQAALRAMNRDVTFRTGNWADVKTWLERGEVQCLPLVGRTPEREPHFDFTFPYMSLYGAIVIRTNSTDIASLNDLRGRQVAVMRGDNAEEFLLREERDIQIQPTASFEDALRELAAGRHDAVVIQRLVALRLLNQLNLPNLHILNKPIAEFRQDFCFAVKKGDAHTLALLNEGLALAMADGAFRRLHAKWFAALELPNRRLVIGGDRDFPPYEYLDDHGQPAGYNVDVSRAIARELDLQIEFRFGAWDDIVHGLESGEIDIIQGLFYSPRRGQLFDFSPAHVVNHYVAVTRRTETPPSDMAALAGRSLAMQTGDVFHDILQLHFPGVEVLLVPNQEEILRAVAEGRADCGVAVRGTARKLFEQHGFRDLALGRKPLYSADYAYAVRKGQNAILAQITEGLRVLERSGELRRLQEKWLGLHTPPAMRVILRHVAYVAGPLLALLLVALLWSRLLQRKVNQRTAELRESEAFVRTVLDNLPVGVAVNTVNPNVRFSYINDRFPAIYRTSHAALENPDNFWNAVYEDPAFRDSIKARVLADCATGDPDRLHWDNIPLTRGGETVAYISAGNIPLPDKGLTISTVWDVSERVRAEHRIERLNNVLRAIRDVNQLIVRERDRDTLIREGVRLLVDNRGYSAALLVATGAEHRPMAWAAAGLAADLAPLEALLAGGQLPSCCERIPPFPQVASYESCTEVCTGCPLAARCSRARKFMTRLEHNGIALGFLLAAVDPELPVDAEELSLFTEMAGDFSHALYSLQNEKARAAAEHERENLTSQLAQAQKMEAVGRLAGGVAHDFNNLLMGILGYVDLCRDALPPDHPIREWLDEITLGARRSADLTRQLLAFARKQTIAPRILDMNESVAGMIKLLHRLLGEDIDLVWEPGPDVPPVKIDPSQLDQVLANLCVNARHAITGPGKLTIETQAASIDAAYCAQHAEATPGPYAMLAVSDNGCGMDRETLDHLFEPFFTTRKHGKGTGLGLATIYGIVKQNNGFINVYSEPGQGATFKIFLPRTNKGAADTGPPGAKERAADSPSGSETILLVEDEKSIRDVTGQFLRNLGYRMLVADGPAAALRLVQDHPGEIHLLLTDVVMPDMSGRDLAERLRRTRPGLICLYMSGYTADTIAHHGVLEESVHFLQKPVSLNALAVTIRDLLDKRGGPPAAEP